jgi:peptide-methionine (S)-S-oxide reductase
MEGVKRTVVGYTGGVESSPTYTAIKDSTEAIMVEFDPDIVSYEAILDEWAKSHAPFFPQKCQYRSAIFYNSEEQREAALRVIGKLQSKNEERKVYADVEPVSAFYRAEEYHQDFLNKQKSARRFQPF